MSLRTFHIVFIVASIALSFGFGAWCVSSYRSEPQGSLLAMGIPAIAAGVALIVYGIWFFRKIRTPEQERERRRKLFRSVPAAVAVFVLAGRDLPACSVCYGEAEGPMIDAARLGVYLLFGLVLMVQIGFAAFFIRLRKRSKQHKLQTGTRGPAQHGAR